VFVLQEEKVGLFPFACKLLKYISIFNLTKMSFVHCIFLVSYFRWIHTTNLQVLICILIMFLTFNI
jgi:hypothetical protein